MTKKDGIERLIYDPQVQKLFRSQKHVSKFKYSNHQIILRITKIVHIFRVNNISYNKTLPLL